MTIVAVGPCMTKCQDAGPEFILLILLEQVTTLHGYIWGDYCHKIMVIYKKTSGLLRCFYVVVLVALIYFDTTKEI